MNKITKDYLNQLLTLYNQRDALVTSLDTIQKSKGNTQLVLQDVTAMPQPRILWSSSDKKLLDVIYGNIKQQIVDIDTQIDKLGGAI